LVAIVLSQLCHVSTRTILLENENRRKNTLAVFNEYV